MNGPTICPEYLTFMVEFVALILHQSKAKAINGMDTAMLTMIALYLSTNPEVHDMFLERLEDKSEFVRETWGGYYIKVIGFNRHSCSKSRVDIRTLLERIIK